MPVVVTQTWNGAQVEGADNGSISSDYFITGTSDEFVAYAALNAATAAAFGGFVKDGVTIDRRLDATSWAGSVSWGPFETKAVGDSSFSFDTGGGSAHVATSLATVSATKAAGMPAAPNFRGAIGVTDDGVEGVDITAPAYNFQETHFFDVAYVTAAYKITLFTLTGAWNAGVYKGFAIGECMFAGASGSLKDHSMWEITYKFVCLPNIVNLAVGPITVPLKRGHDHVWLRYREVEDAAAGHLGRQPIAAYVEQVSPSGNLALLGI